MDSEYSVNLLCKIKTKYVNLQSIADTSIKRCISLQSTPMLKVVFTHVWYCDFVDNAFSYERELIVCSFQQGISKHAKGKGSSLQIICKAHTLFFCFFCVLFCCLFVCLFVFTLWDRNADHEERHWQLHLNSYYKLLLKASQSTGVKGISNGSNNRPIMFWHKSEHINNKI